MRFVENLSLIMGTSKADKEKSTVQLNRERQRENSKIRSPVTRVTSTHIESQAHSFSELPPHSSQIAQPRPTISANSQYCSKAALKRRLTVLVLDFTVLYLTIVESPLGEVGPAVHTWRHTHLFIWICLPFFTKRFSLLNRFTFCFLIEFYVNRLNDLMCYSPVGAINLKPQGLKLKLQYSFNTNNSSAWKQRVLNNNKKFFIFKMS